jgi:large conductance mechanosensitive channel
MAKKGMIQEFKEFLLTGDLMSVAVAFIMGAAIKAVIDSFVSNLFLGLLAIFLPDDKVSFADIAFGPAKTVFKPGTTAAQKTAMDPAQILSTGKPVRIGAFIDDLIRFITLAFVVFMIVKAYKKMANRGLASDGPSTNDLLTEIRDNLKAGR